LCGDQLYWSGPAVAFRGSKQGLAAFDAELFNKHHTDVILFGDTRTLHAPIFPVAKEYNATVHVFEEGYLRAFWITLERGGVNARSSLSRNPR
jgi:capsular polysaccharide export protein